MASVLEEHKLPETYLCKICDTDVPLTEVHECCTECERETCQCEQYCPHCDEYECVCIQCPEHIVSVYECGCHCGGCDHYYKECQCEGRHGSIKDINWCEAKEIPWEEAWPVVDKAVHCRLDLGQVASDFYLMEVMRNHALIKAKPPLSKERFNEAAALLGLDAEFVDSEKIEDLKAELTTMVNEVFCPFVDETAELIRQYFHLACGGEIRHHRAVGRKVLPLNDREGAWGAWKDVFDTYGIPALEQMVELFLDFDSTDYGGKAWATAAKVLLAFEKGELGPDEFTNKVCFLDRAWSLQHNNGSILNKVNWQRGDLPSVFIAHSSDPPGITHLYRLASESVKTLYDSYMAAIKTANVELHAYS